MLDLIFVRDYLGNFSYYVINSPIVNLNKSGIRYLLTSACFDSGNNIDISTGKWITLNFKIEPFTIPQSTNVINENCKENNGWYKDKGLGF